MAIFTGMMAIFTGKMAIFTGKMRNVLKRIKNQFSDLCDCLVFELRSFNFDHFSKKAKKNVVLEDAQCSETDFWMLWTVVSFLIFEIWSILYSSFVVNWGFQ